MKENDRSSYKKPASHPDKYLSGKLNLDSYWDAKGEAVEIKNDNLIT